MDPELRHAAVSAVLDDGVPVQAAADAAGVTRPTIERWVRIETDRRALAPAAAPEPPQAPEAPPPPPDDPPPGDDDALSIVRELLANARRAEREARAIGNTAAASKARSDIGKAAAVLARLERDKAQAGDLLSVSRAEIDAAIGRVQEKFEALAARGLVCARCSRELSIEWGGESARKGLEDAAHGR